MDLRTRLDNLAPLITAARSGNLPVLVDGEVISLGPGKSTTEPVQVVLSARKFAQLYWPNRDMPLLAGAIETCLDDMEMVGAWWQAKASVKL